MKCFKLMVGLLIGLLVSNHVLSKIITNLPGLDTPINFKQYSGYINVDPENGTRLFYWFVESQSDPSNDPLVLWLNGGPGCSSLGGFLGELGPFYVKPNMTLGINGYSWNKIANMIFLEAPAGVGFSKTNKQFQYNDERTASDSLKYLLKFFKMYPHLKFNDFWITGESYAGHYIPMLAAKIINHNHQVSSKDDAINLKGLMMGNPFTVDGIDKGAIYDYEFSHQLISMATYNSIRKHCNYTFRGPLPSRELDLLKCTVFEKIAVEEMGPISLDNIYAGVCPSDQRYSYSNGEALLKYLARSKTAISAYAKSAVGRITANSPYNPCEGNYVQAYLNVPSVQQAIYAEATKWINCNDALKYSADDDSDSMLPYYTNILFPAQLRVLIYSGDLDILGCATGARRWVSMLKLKVIEPWHYWMDAKGQVGGYTEVYDHLTFTTVRNAGHHVPSDQPGRAYDMFSRFLHKR